MLVVDLMHEFELGVWRSTLVHVIIVLHVAVPRGSKVADFNAQYLPSLSTFIAYLKLGKVPADSNIWQGHYSTLLQQCI